MNRMLVRQYGTIKFIEVVEMRCYREEVAYFEAFV